MSRDQSLCEEGEEGEEGGGEEEDDVISDVKVRVIISLWCKGGRCLLYLYLNVYICINFKIYINNKYQYQY